MRVGQGYFVGLWFRVRRTCKERNCQTGFFSAIRQGGTQKRLFTPHATEWRDRSRALAAQESRWRRDPAKPWLRQRQSIRRDRRELPDKRWKRALDSPGFPGAIQSPSQTPAI